jgi:hypothetical protein
VVADASEMVFVFLGDRTHSKECLTKEKVLWIIQAKGDDLIQYLI